MNGNSVRFDLDEEPAIGTFQLTVVSARGLKIREELFGFDVPDVYFDVRLGGETFTTTVKHNNVTPEWNESYDLKLLQHDQVIQIEGRDSNERGENSDVTIGKAHTTADKILLAGGRIELELLNNEGVGSGVFVTLHGHMV